VLPLIAKKTQNEHNFITLGKISKDEKPEILQRGFQLNQQGKIFLKKYYERRQKFSLFPLKGYSIKYETIIRLHFINH
jgi:hypothetical protein